MVTKRGIIFILLLIIILLSILYVKANMNEGLVNSTVNQHLFVSRNLIVVNVPYTYDTKYAAGYLDLMENFSQVEFRDDSAYALLKVGNIKDDRYGILLDNQKIAIHLLGCDLSNLACMFRINGVPTGRLYNPGLIKKSTFNINENYTLQLNSITFDYCDGERFCDLDKEAYHLVNISVIAR